MFSVIYYQLFRTRLFRIPRYFELIVLPYTLNQPHYFELVENRVRTQEHSWKRIAFYLSSCCVINDLTMLDSRAVSR